MPRPTATDFRGASPSTGLNSRAVCDSCIHHLFEAQAAAQPNSVAVVCGNERWSYGELNMKANQLAHHLSRNGVKPGVLVGVFLDRTFELVVGILGILKAGGAYVPIDINYPKDRVAFMLKDARIPVVVTHSALKMAFPDSDAKAVCLDRDASQFTRESTINPASGIQPHHVAYVIYTSGSTGTPKGTLISHNNVRRLFQATQPWFGFSQNDVWTLFHSCAFDFSVWELWGALIYGGKLVVVPFSVSRTPTAFYRMLLEEGVTVLNQTPSAFRQLIRAEEMAEKRTGLALRLIIFGGEALDIKSLRPWFDRHGDQLPQLINMYGITETTVHVTYSPIRAADLSGGSVIGIPIPDLQIYLLDEQKRLVRAGECGEICVGGAGVCCGYLNRPELTSQKFIPDPFSSAPGSRLYCSGDLGRELPDGDLEYLGRMDQQVKIRGFRIELGEIESVINQHPAVRESVVIVREDVSGEKNLAAYLIKRPGTEVSLSIIRQRLRERLPEYMVPSSFQFIDDLPLTVNGKLDVATLPVPDNPVLRSSQPRVPETHLEQAINDIWQDVLRRSSFGLDLNFFDVGGNSFNLAQVHTRLEKLLRREFPITDLFAHTTIRAMAAHLKANQEPRNGLSGHRARAEHQRGAFSTRRNRHHDT